MKKPFEKIIVKEIAGKNLIIEVTSPALLSSVTKLGFIPDNNFLSKPITNDLERQVLAKELIGLNALFSAGKDWSPAELMLYYKELGIISGFQMISWKNPDTYVITSE